MIQTCRFERVDIQIIPEDRLWDFRTMARALRWMHCRFVRSLLKGKQSETATLITGSDKISVIVVDDDVFVCRALKTQLEILGFNVLTFPNAEDLLASEFPTCNTCLLLDVYLGGMNGIELFQHLIEKRIELPTILMTGRDDRLTRRLMRAAKPGASLFKPFDQDALLRAIQSAMHPTSKSCR